MEDDLKLQDFDQWVKIFILKHEGENLSKESKISGHPNIHVIRNTVGISLVIKDWRKVTKFSSSTKTHGLSSVGTKSKKRVSNMNECQSVGSLVRAWCQSMS